MRPWLSGALIALALFTSPAAQAAGEGPLTHACLEVNEALRGPCRGGEQAVSYASANCRWAGVRPDTACNTPLGPQASAAAVDAFAGSWVDRVLGLQYELAGDVPLRNAPWVGTHNSFNSVAEMGPTLSDLDSNQQLTLVDQLRLGVRSLELDVHWFPSLAAGGARAPVVCHARGANEGHLGCTIEKTLQPVLSEIAGWLAGHPAEVLLLYLEDHLEGLDGHDAAARALEATLGDVIYRPGGGTCQELPLDLTRDAVLAAGKQVIVASKCGTGAAWQAVAFDWTRHEEERPRGYQDFPDCGPDFDRATYDTELVRYYEDSTALTAGAGDPDEGITPATAARMARCGVDLTGMDQLLPDDGRLEALVWSWATNEPSAAGDCAIQRAHARWEARDCGEHHAVACRAQDGTWSVAVPAVPAVAAPARCGGDAEHAVPRTGYEGQLLRVAMEAAGAPTAWLGQHRDGERWRALDAR